MGYRAATALTLPIGWAMSQIAVRLIYYGLITPLGLLFRLTGRDALKRKRPVAAQTYWKERVARTEIGSYFRQS